MADINNSQKIPFTLVITNAAGQPAQVDGVPTYASSDETVLTLEVAADGLSGFAVAGAPGVGRFTVKADADLGSGVTEITGVSEDVNVTVDPTNAASVLNFTLGAPVPKV